MLCKAISHETSTSTSNPKDFVDPPCVSHPIPSENAEVIGLGGKKCMVQ